MKKVLFLGGNNNQLAYLNAINLLGYKTIVTDTNGEAPASNNCTRFYKCGYTDIDGLIEIGKLENFTSTDKVFTAAAQFSHIGAAGFCEYFDIKYPRLETIDMCLDKAKFYPAFQAFGIPIPKTKLVNSVSQLEDALSSAVASDFFYLKSDYSKNPNYVFRFSGESPPWERFFWGRDRYLRNNYVLQPEISGPSLRINIFGKRFHVFDFKTGLLSTIHHSNLAKHRVIQNLLAFMKRNELSNWLIKFDIILNEDFYVVLDIGIDPPSRMRKYAESKNINFPYHYIKQYLENIISYPPELER